MKACGLARAVGALLLVLGASHAQAMLISGPDIISAPASVIDDAPGATNFHQQAFDEGHGILLTSDLAVDGGLISAGSLVDSHMIFLNTPVGTDLVTDTATWGFDGLILGVMSDSGGSLEAASSSLLGAAGTVYPSAFRYRGLEGRDAYTVSGSSLQLTMYASEPGDWIRVVTETNDVPEPPVLALLGFGLLGLGVLQKLRGRR
jgi:hypothetical protein